MGLVRGWLKKWFYDMYFPMEAENKELLVEGAKTFGIHLDRKTVLAFDLYLKELLKWNQKINLTAIRTEKEIVLKHFLDSLSVCPFLPDQVSILDVGSGAGFPGIPFKMVRPNLEMTLIDSVRKKIDFQRHIIRMLDLKGIEAIHGRVQDEAILQHYGKKFDITVSRAFSDLRTLLILSSPFLKERGWVLAMKGTMKKDEMELNPKAGETPYQLKRMASITLPTSHLKRTILLFQKG